MKGKKSEYIGCYSIPDGYFGDRINAQVLFDGKKLIYAFPFGFISSPHLPMSIADKKEALWMIDNHPNGKAYFRHLEVTQ